MNNGKKKINVKTDTGKVKKVIKRQKRRRKKLILESMISKLILCSICVRFLQREYMCACTIALGNRAYEIGKTLGNDYTRKKNV
jgi:hypothetical protein